MKTTVKTRAPRLAHTFYLGLIAFFGFTGPVAHGASCAVRIIDESPMLGDTKSVGQEVVLRAEVDGGYLYEWLVHGPTIRSYDESVDTGFKTDKVEPIARVIKENPIYFFWTNTGVWRVHAVAFADNAKCGEAIREFTVERNTDDRNRQPEDFYTSCCKMSPPATPERVLRAHSRWHAGHACCPAGYDGEDFLVFHRKFLSRMNSWRAFFGYPALGSYHGNGAIPPMEAGFTLEHASRSREDGGNPLLSWFTEADGTSARPATACLAGGQKKLSDFSNLKQLGCALTQPWHNRVHSTIGGEDGDMSSTRTAPKDPIFWRFHNFISGFGTILGDWEVVKSDGPPGGSWEVPSRGSGVSRLASVKYRFWEPVINVEAMNLAVNGSPATAVTFNEESEYVFTGFTVPEEGIVTVALSAGNITDSDGLSFPGDSWTVRVCADCDGDGVPNEIDNCPNSLNPDQSDINGNGIGDACEHEFFIPPEFTSITLGDNMVTISWIGKGVLQSSPTVPGTWMAIPGARSPYATVVRSSNLTETRFFRLIQPGPQLLANGNLDLCQTHEVVPGFFLPKPRLWVNEGIRRISGPYEDELSSEPWAGPAPTPVTTDGNQNPPHPEGCGGADCGVFFKPFTGNVAAGDATGHLYQDKPATPGTTYLLIGWAGAEQNAVMGGAEFALEFFDAGTNRIGGSVLDLLPTLFVPNGQPFNYKQHTILATAPASTVRVRVRASMINAMANPAGGGQAFVVDDFELRHLYHYDEHAHH